MTLTLIHTWRQKVQCQRQSLLRLVGCQKWQLQVFAPEGDGHPGDEQNHICHVGDCVARRHGKRQGRCFHLEWFKSASDGPFIFLTHAPSEEYVMACVCKRVHVYAAHQVALNSHGLIGEFRAWPTLAKYSKVDLFLIWGFWLACCLCLYIQTACTWIQLYGHTWDWKSERRYSDRD